MILAQQLHVPPILKINRFWSLTAGSTEFSSWKCLAGTISMYITNSLDAFAKERPERNYLYSLDTFLEKVVGEK